MPEPKLGIGLTDSGNINLRCEHCKQPFHEHEKTKEFHENGRWSWNYSCPSEGEAA